MRQLQLEDIRKVTAGSLCVGSRVLDTYGGIHALTAVARRGVWVDTTRDDGWADRFKHDDLVMVAAESPLNPPSEEPN